MSTNLREIINQRILTDIFSICREDCQYKVLVLDTLAAKIISSCCKMTDIMSENIMIIENLHKKRQPMRRKDAIYFLSPTEKSVNDLLEDWKSNSPEKMQYRKANIFFTDRVAADLIQKIAKSPLQGEARLLETPNNVSK